MTNPDRHIRIIGIRGIPAKHGGFETFAEQLALYLIGKGWKITVYCQVNETGQLFEDTWNDIRRVFVPVNGDGALASVVFDWKSIHHARKEAGHTLTLGYNTALFNVFLRSSKFLNLMNMDGIEWKRRKWRWFEKLWLWMNEFAGTLFSDLLIADHPEIAKHLERHTSLTRIRVIPYGARMVTGADKSVLNKYSLEDKKYAVVIARIEPENSILEIVEAYSCQTRKFKLVILGSLDPHKPYHLKIRKAANDQVEFIGPVYETAEVDALRFYSYLYLHGHQVGGTNPSLVEAMGAGQCVVARDNVFNRWVLGDTNGLYFNTIDDLDRIFYLLDQNELSPQQYGNAAFAEYKQRFLWEKILLDYENLLLFEG